MQTETQTPKLTVAEMLAAKLGPALANPAKDIFSMKHPESRESVVFYARHGFFQVRGKKIKGDADAFATWAESNGFV